MNDDLKDLAMRFIVGAYEGNTSVVDELAADDIISTYPIFMKLFNTPVLRGVEAYRNYILVMNCLKSLLTTMLKK